MADEKKYNLAQFRFHGKNAKKITNDGFKVTRKQDITERTSSDSHNPYDVEFGKETFEWELSDVAPKHRKFFEEVMDNQKENPSELPNIATYDYNELTGDLVADDIFYGVWVSEVSKENANQPFSVKGGARRKKRVS